MPPWKLSLWKQAEQIFIEFFNRLGQLQAPDDTTLTYSLRRLPNVMIAQSNQPLKAQTTKKI
ncbi:MAG: hypothetical protein HRU08_10615 [Oleispira sp.]|jgi:hypothetical protein|nr:hypothetical protein [Oleispira sp.]